MKELRSTFTASDGAVISYLDIGEGIPFVWIHGWGGEEMCIRDRPILGERGN